MGKRSTLPLTPYKSRAKFRSSPEWRDWRLQVLERDKNTCQCCGRRYPSARLQCHHKDLNKEKYMVLDNLDDFVALCSVCHKTVHSMYTKVCSKKVAFQGHPALRHLVLSFFK